MFFQNCGPQPEFANTSKVHQTTAAFIEGKYDIFMFAEHSLYPPKLSSGSTWHDRMRTGPKHTYSVTSYNRREPRTSLWNKKGGCAITVTSPFRSRKTSEGVDKQGLGRWCWIRFYRKGTGHTRIVSAYRPCKSKKTEGTAWRQHQRYFREKGIKGDPRDLF